MVAVVVERVRRDEWSASYGKSLFGTFTPFVRWLYKEVEILDQVPRNIGDLRIETASKQVEVFDVADVKRYLTADDDIPSEILDRSEKINTIWADLSGAQPLGEFIQHYFPPDRELIGAQQ